MSNAGELVALAAGQRGVVLLQLHVGWGTVRVVMLLLWYAHSHQSHDGRLLASCVLLFSFP
jgi:hypothetical protein